jgi:hypothetical protein
LAPQLDEAVCHAVNACEQASFGDLEDNQQSGLTRNEDIAQVTGKAAHGVDHTIVNGDVEARQFSVYGFRHNRLVVVESIASPADHLAARQLLATAIALTPSDVEAL